jgi:hypothetical protein
MLCPNGTVKPFLASLVEPVAYLKPELRVVVRFMNDTATAYAALELTVA